MLPVGAKPEEAGVAAVAVFRHNCRSASSAASLCFMCRDLTVLRFSGGQLADGSTATTHLAHNHSLPNVHNPHQAHNPTTSLSHGTARQLQARFAALDLAYVAEGRFDASWELWLAPWDIAAGILLVQEAGGVVTDLDGAERGVEAGAVVTGNPAMHAWLVEHLRPGDALHSSP